MVFELLDIDGDGHITQTEYNKGFDILDKDQNGFLTRSEFGIASKLFFDLLDKNGDGKLSPKGPGPQEAHRNVCGPHRRQLVTRMPVLYLYLVCLLWTCPQIQANRNSILNHDNYASAKWMNLPPNIDRF